MILASHPKNLSGNTCFSSDLPNRLIFDSFFLFFFFGDDSAYSGSGGCGIYKSWKALVAIISFLPASLKNDD